MKFRTFFLAVILLATGFAVPAQASPEKEATHQSFSMAPTNTSTPLGVSTISVRPPGSSSVRLGRTLAVSGQVGGDSPANRVVRLELETPRGWMRVATATSDTAGGYSIEVPTDWYFSGTLRTSVEATSTTAAASTPDTFAVKVSPAYKPRGSARHFGLMGFARWNPCQTITYRVNAAGAPKRALGMVRQALKRVHQASGLRFSYAGATHAIAWRTDHKGQRLSPAALTISWANVRQVSGLRGGVVGLGGMAAASNGWAQSAGVTLERNSRLKRGFGAGQTWGVLLLHELGHAMGLGHARDGEQVMAPSISPRSLAAYQAGDLTGLRKVGARGGCPRDAPRASARRTTGTTLVRP